MHTAIQSIYRDLEYARSLIKNRDGKVSDDTLEDSEESWTFIGDDNDPELIKRVQGWENFTAQGQGVRKNGDSDGGASGSKSSGADMLASSTSMN